jgi:hypothetical protein
MPARVRWRGDKTVIELFIAGICGWEAGLRRYFPGKSDKGSQQDIKN